MKMANKSRGFCSKSGGKHLSPPKKRKIFKIGALMRKKINRAKNRL
jgi:hypothetical protein